MRFLLRCIGWALIVSAAVSPVLFRKAELAEMLFVYFGLFAMGVATLWSVATWKDGVISRCMKHDYCSFASGHCGRCNNLLMGSFEDSDWPAKLAAYRQSISKFYWRLRLRLLARQEQRRTQTLRRIHRVRDLRTHLREAPLKPVIPNDNMNVISRYLSQWSNDPSCEDTHSLLHLEAEALKAEWLWRRHTNAVQH